MKESKKHRDKKKRRDEKFRRSLAKALQSNQDEVQCRFFATS